MRTKILISIMVLATLALIWVVCAFAQDDIKVNVHLETHMELAIFHDESAAKVWADEYQGRIEVRPDSTYIVWYPVTTAESNPNDWKEQ